METREQIDLEYEGVRNAFATDHSAGRKIANKHGTKSIRPAQNRELSAGTRAEKYYNLVDENVKMKTHQNILDGELKKMQTRMNRIKGMISKERRLNGAVVAPNFEKELDAIIDENTEL